MMMVLVMTALYLRHMARRDCGNHPYIVTSALKDNARLGRRACLAGQTRRSPRGAVLGCRAFLWTPLLRTVRDLKRNGPPEGPRRGTFVRGGKPQLPRGSPSLADAVARPTRQGAKSHSVFIHLIVITSKP
jgi:hypothetical protein